MNLPNLLIVGAAKSGTTSLHNYLKQHPDIFMSNHKEPHFLINNEIGVNRIPKGINNLQDYSNLFSNGASHKYRGESSAMYLQFPEIAIKNIDRYLDEDVKIIIMLRNPIERAFSGYQHVKRYNLDEDLDFEDALEISEQRYFTNNNITPASRYIHIGMYNEFVRKFKTKFKTNVHIIIYKDFINNTNQELSRLFIFLGIKDVQIDFNKQYMVGGWKWKNDLFRKIFMKRHFLKKFIPFKRLIRAAFKSFATDSVEKIDDTIREKLIGIYKDDIKNLSKFLNVDLNFWTK
tara:strand:+ start:337 stop:1206 length:870 start_codon:yes stop_codon:yes gene_type:complete